MRSSRITQCIPNFLRSGISICLGFLIFVAAIKLLPATAMSILSVTGTGTDTYPGGEVNYQLELLNHTDEIIYDGLISATLPSGFSYVPGSTIALGEGWPMQSQEPAINGQTLTWGPYNLPAAGIKVHNPYGIHTLMESCDGIPALHLDGAKILAGNGGYVTQLFYPIDTTTTGPSECAINFVQEAYARNLIPIIRLQGQRINGIWQAPSPGPSGNYTEIAQAYTRYVAGLPRRDTNPLYITIWNEPDLWIEWSGQPNAVQYARFFVAVSNAIRQLGDARIRIVNGALTPGNLTFLNQMLSVPGFRDAFDVWASHCYPYNHPAWYNIHSGTARYGTYAIDCYLHELAMINNQGRPNVKVIIKETGYALGNNTFGFEGFPTINETNRVQYIASAFADYWQTWPEVVAVTPFELTDESGHWAAFDWVYPYWPYPSHPQFDAVAALPKPAGQLQPYGFQIIFKAIVATNVPTGTYTLNLSGSEHNGSVVSATQVASVTVKTSTPQQYTFLPVIIKSPGNTGPWYLTTPLTGSISPREGAIVPTHFLTSSTALLSASKKIIDIPLSGTPQALVLDEVARLGAVLLSDGHLEIIDLAQQNSISTLFVGNQPYAVTAASPGIVYVAFADGIAQVDLKDEIELTRRLGLGRVTGLAWDSVQQRLFVTDAERNRLLVFNTDLSEIAPPVLLSYQPNQLIYNGVTDELFIAFPAVSRIVSLSANDYTEKGQARLVGGPILDMALDAGQNQLYTLSAIAPHQRGITVLQTLSLRPLALIAGSNQLPLQTASAITLGSGNNLLIAETSNLLQMSGDSFSINNNITTKNLIAAQMLRVYRATGAIYTLDSQHHRLRVYQ